MAVRLGFLVLLVFFSFSTEAARVSTGVGQIFKLYAYDDVGAVQERDGADVVAWFDTGLTQCPAGVWLSPSAPGYKTLVSFL